MKDRFISSLLSLYGLFIVWLSLFAFDFGLRASSTTTEIITSQCIDHTPRLRNHPYVLELSYQAQSYKVHVPLAFWKEVAPGKALFVVEEKGLLSKRRYRLFVLDLTGAYLLIPLEGPSNLTNCTPIGLGLITQPDFNLFIKQMEPQNA